MIGCFGQLYDLHEGIAFAKLMDVVTPKKVIALETMMAKRSLLRYNSSSFCDKPSELDINKVDDGTGGKGTV